MCSFCRLTLRYFCTFDSGEEMRDRCGCFACSNLHVLSPGVSGDNKNGRVGRFFFSSLYGASTSPLCFQQEAVRLCEGSVAWMRKVNVFFFSLPTLQTHSVLSVHCGTWREWDLNLFNPPSHRPSDVASFPGFDAQDQVGFSYLLKPQVKTKYLMYPLRSFSKCTYL